MRVVQRVADRLLSRFVPSVEASALWYWKCGACSIKDPDCAGNYRKRCQYCFDSTGQCTTTEYRCC
jgi:hypothetical protein